MGEDPEPRIDPDGIPEPLMRVLQRTLAKDPDMRYATAAATRRALEQVIDSLELSATTEDVSEHLAEHFADLAKQRKTIVYEEDSATKWQL
jgi:hypothetical protein